jgi:CheY-like chemotaxis protein
MTAAAGIPTRTLRVLVADDNADFAENIAEILGIEGHSVTVAYDGEEAVRRASAESFDLVLLDVKMPRKDGIQALLEIRSKSPATTIVMLTAYASRVDRVIQAGALGVLRKPVDLTELLRFVQRAVSGSGSHGPA